MSIALNRIDAQIEKLSLMLKAAQQPEPSPDKTDREEMLFDLMDTLFEPRDVPVWIQDLNGNVIYTNSAFSALFSKGPLYKVSKADGVWNGNSSDMIRSVDEEVARSHKAMMAMQELSGSLYQVRKWPVFLGDNLIGIAGEIAGDEQTRLQASG